MWDDELKIIEQNGRTELKIILFEKQFRNDKLQLNNELRWSLE